MKMKSNLLRSSAFRSFLYSFVGILLITFGLMSVIAAWHFSENLKNEDIRVTRNKLYTVVEDMETQNDSMRTIAMRIATRNEFSMNYLKKSKYYEIEMLEQLKMFDQPFGVYEKYFLKYNSSDLVYTSEGGTRPFELYCRTEIGQDSYQPLQELFEQLNGNEKIPFKIYKHGEVVLWIYPLKSYSTNQKYSEGILCFKISKESLEERIEQLVQLTSEDLVLHYKDIHLLGEEKSGTEEWIEANSSNAGFRIRYPLSEKNQFLWKNIFSIKEIIILAIIFILLLLLGIGIAYWNYKPMQSLAEKYWATSDGLLEVEWKSIDNLISSLLSGREKNIEMIQRQYRIIQEQIIGLIVSGRYSDRVKEQMALLNIRLEAPVYGVIKCIFSEVREAEQQYKWIHEAIEDLSDEDMKLYSSWDENGALYVLVAVDEVYRISESEELVQSLLETKGLDIKTKITDICYELNQIGRIASEDDSIIEQNMQVNEQMTSDMVETMGKESNSTAALAVGFIRENYTDYDLSLEAIAQRFQITPTYLSRIVKQEVGKSYKEFLTELRIAEAKRILLQSDMNVAEVCKMVGYMNVPHFIKLFQKNAGVTPAKFREEMKQEHLNKED